MGGIYIIKSRVKPERCYVGSTIDFHRRQYDHISLLRRGRHHSPKLQNHFNKYGEDDLIFVELMPCPNDELIIMEQFYINALSPWFNVYTTAYSPLGHRHSEGTKKKIGDANRGRKRTAVSRRRMSVAQTGKRASEKSRAKMSESRRGCKNHFYGKQHSDETKRRLSEVLTGKMSGEKNPFFGRSHDGDTRLRMSEGHQDVSGENNPMFGKHHTAEARQKMSRAKRGKKWSDEARVKFMSLKRRGRSTRVVDIESGVLYNSIREAAHGINVSYSLLKKYLRGESANKTTIRLV